MNKEQKTALVVGVTTSFITTFLGSALNIAIPMMGDYFHMGATSVGWIVTSYMLIVAALSVPLGKIADSTSRRKFLLVGIIIVGLTSILAVFAKTAAMIIAVRSVCGFGASMIFATNMPIAISKFPGSQRGKAIGTVTSGTYAGLALGPVFGGILNNMWGWKSIFVFTAIVSAVALAVAIAGLDKTEESEGLGKFDLAGNVSYVLMILTLIYGLTVLNSAKFGWLFIVAALVFGFIFARVELRTENPVIDVRIFARDSIFTLSNITALFNYSATFALGYMTSIYLQVIHGMTSQAAGLVLIAQPVFMAVLSPKMGKLSDRIPAYKLASGGMALCALALISFAFIGENTPVAVIIIALSVAGIGIALFSSPNTNVIMSRVHPSKFSVANSILSTMRTTGQSTGMAIITIVVSGIVGNVSLYEVPAEELIKTIHVSFIIFTALCILGIFMSLQRKKVTDDQE